MKVRFLPVATCKLCCVTDTLHLANHSSGDLMLSYSTEYERDVVRRVSDIWTMLLSVLTHQSSVSIYNLSTIGVIDPISLEGGR